MLSQSNVERPRCPPNVLEATSTLEHINNPNRRTSYKLANFIFLICGLGHKIFPLFHITFRMPTGCTSPTSIKARVEEPVDVNRPAYLEQW